MAGNQDIVVQRLKRILADDLNLSLNIDHIADDAALTDGGLNLDSIVIVELIALIESKFNFQFDDADLRTSTFANLKALAAVIAKRITI